MPEDEEPADEFTEEENVYKDESRDDLVENDELTPDEEGFMQGYDDAEEEKEEKKEKEQE